MSKLRPQLSEGLCRRHGETVRGHGALQPSYRKVETQDALRPLWKHPSWATVGRAWLDPSGTSRAQGKDPQVSKAKKHWKSLITISVLRPISPLAILSGPYHPHHLHSCSKHGAEMTQRLLPLQSHGEEPPHPPEPLPPGPRPPGVAQGRFYRASLPVPPYPASGWVSGGRVSPCSSAIASSRFRMRSSVTSHDRLLPSLGWPSLSLRYSSTSGHATP